MIYVEEGLAHTPVEISYWDGKLRAEYDAHLLTEYNCRWDNNEIRRSCSGSKSRCTHLVPFSLGRTARHQPACPASLRCRSAPAGSDRTFSTCASRRPAW